jgi:opacity protein-like surface antigen
MKKVLLLASAVLTLNTAKSQVVDEGNVLVSAGYGFPNVVGSIFEQLENEQDFKTTSFGPVYAKFEYLISPKNGIGLNIAYGSHKSTYSSEDYLYDISTGNYTTVYYKEKTERITYSFLLRYNYHFSNSEKLDAYFGAGVGYRYARWKTTSDNPNSLYTFNTPNFFPFGFETTIGVRYMPTSIFGLYAEAGLAKSPVQVGVSLKF